MPVDQTLLTALSSHIAAQASELTLLTAARDALSAQVDLEGLLANMTSQRDALRTELDAAYATIEARDAMVLQRDAQLAERDGQLQQHITWLQQAQAAQAASAQQVTTLQGQIATLNSNITALTNQRNTLQTQLNAANTRIAQLEAQLGTTNPPPAVDPTTRKRVVITTDMQMMTGTTATTGDKDDVQSLIHALLYQDRLDIRGIISSNTKFQPGANDVSFINRVIDEYAKDEAKLRARSTSYKTATALRALAIQGTKINGAGGNPPPASMGSAHIIAEARAAKAVGQPLYLVAWGGMGDIVRALADAEDIRDTVRVWTVDGSGQEPEAFKWMNLNLPDVWWVNQAEGNWRGVYSTEGHLEIDIDLAEVQAFAVGRGALGALLAANAEDLRGAASSTVDPLIRHGLKMGDSASILYLIDPTSNQDDPTGESWGGSYMVAPATPRNASYPNAGEQRWVNKSVFAESLGYSPSAGARTIFKWRANWLADYQTRLNWLSGSVVVNPPVEPDNPPPTSGFDEFAETTPMPEPWTVLSSFRPTVSVPAEIVVHPDDAYVDIPISVDQLPRSTVTVAMGGVSNVTGGGINVGGGSAFFPNGKKDVVFTRNGVLTQYRRLALPASFAHGQFFTFSFRLADDQFANTTLGPKVTIRADSAATPAPTTPPTLVMPRPRMLETVGAPRWNPNMHAYDITDSGAKNNASVPWSSFPTQAEAAWRGRPSHGPTQDGNQETGWYANDYNVTAESRLIGARAPHQKIVVGGQNVLRLHADVLPVPMALNGKTYPHQASMISGQFIDGACLRRGLFRVQCTNPIDIKKWSAIWFIKRDPDNKRHNWPPEIDVIENFNGVYGAFGGSWNNRYWSSSALHYGPHGSNNRRGARGTPVRTEQHPWLPQTDMAAINDFAVYIGDNEIITFLNGIEMVAWPQALNDETGNGNWDFFPMINIAVKGGTEVVANAANSNMDIHGMQNFHHDSVKLLRAA